ncbi:hypothetical protein JCM17380_02210 [Desulfosporosinus burensis]
MLLPPVLTKRLNKVVNKTIKHGKAVHNKLFLSNRCKIITMDTMDIMEIVGVMTECTVTGLVTWVGKEMRLEQGRRFAIGACPAP